MPQFKTLKDKHFIATNIKTKVNDMSVEKPKVEQVIFEISGEEKPNKLTSKPRKEQTRSQKIQEDGFSMTVEDDKEVPYTLGELPEIFKEISRALQSHELVEVKANVTKGVFEDDDGSTSTHYFISSNAIDTVELVDPKLEDEDEKESTEEDKPEGF